MSSLSGNTGLTVSTWAPSLRTERRHYTATVDKHDGHAGTAMWTPATHARAQAGQHSTDTSWEGSLQALLPPPGAHPLLAVDPLVLTPEEAAWLAVHCQVLHVWPSMQAWASHAAAEGSAAPLPNGALLECLSGTLPHFAERLWMYGAARRGGWVPRVGGPFAGHLVVYPDGPAAGHAPLTLLHAPAPRPTWRRVMGPSRVSSSVRKALVLVEAPPGLTAQEAVGNPGQLTGLMLRGIHVDLQISTSRREALQSTVRQWLQTCEGVTPLHPARGPKQSKSGRGAKYAEVVAMAVEGWAYSPPPHNPVPPALPVTSNPWLPGYRAWVKGGR